MADEPAATVVPAEPIAPAVEPEPKADPPDQNLVGEAKRLQKKAEKEATELRERLEALEDRDKSETERERKAREKAEERATDAESRVQTLEKGAWIRTAANEAGFNDPDDAVAFADLADIDSEAEAKRAVKSIAGRKPHLLKAPDPTPPQIGQVVKDGQPTSPAKDPAHEADVEAATAFAGELKKLAGGWVEPASK